MRVGIIGLGKVGREIEQVAAARGDTVFSFRRHEALTNDPEVFVHFAEASTVLSHVAEAVALRRPIVLGTTGWEAQELAVQEVVRQGQGTAFYAPNMLPGVMALLRALQQLRIALPHHTSTGMELHHTEKRDAPSGTARWIERTCHIPFTSLRRGDALGTHRIVFDDPYESLEIVHTVKSRRGFACGALDVAQWLMTQHGWKTYDDYFHSVSNTF